MDSRRFDYLARSLSSVLPRRSVSRGLAVMTGATGLGSLLATNPLFGQEDAEAKTKKKGCRKKGCPQPTNPCQVAVCTKGKKKKSNKGKRPFKCVTQDAPANTPCGPGQVCLAGVCTMAANTCPSSTFCSGNCVDLKTDPENCGSCGTTCTGNQTCQSGKCTCPDSGTCVVSPNALGGWSFANGGVSFVDGPKNPPAGSGSLQIQTTTVGKATFKNSTFAGVPIEDLDVLKYSTFMQDGSTTGVVVPAIKLPVDMTCDGCPPFTTLVFEPTYMANHTVQPKTWQDWDLLSADARWWSSKNLPNGITAFEKYVPWTDILAAIPGATINLDGILVETGSGTPDAVGYVDKLIVNDQTFNFQPD